MKTSLKVVLLSVLYLSCFELYSQEPCKVLMQEIAEKYAGKCKKGLAHGYGIGEGKDKYEGSFKNGLPQGKGKYTWATGEVFEGYWKEGKKDGEGKFYFKINGVDSMRHGIWRNDIFIKKIIPSPYKITHSISVVRYSVSRNKDGFRVLFALLQNGSPNTTASNVQFSATSGTSLTLGSKQGFENVVFPFTCKITYTTLNSFKTMSYPVEFEIVVTEPGDWEVDLNN